MMEGKMLVDFVTWIAVLIIAFAVFMGVLVVMERPRGRRHKRG